MKKVLYYEPSSGFGGSSSNLYHILRQVDKRRVNPVVVTHKDGDQFERIQTLSDVKLEKIPFDKVDSWSNVGYIKTLTEFLFTVVPFSNVLAKYIRDNDVDVIHINTNIMLGLPMILAAKKTQRPVYCYIRESKPLSKIERMFIKYVNKFFVLNSEALKIYSQDIPANRIEIVYDGLDLDQFHQIDSNAFLDEFNLRDYKLVGMVGRIITGKGHVEFAQAAQNVIKQCPQTKFVIVGAVKGDGAEYFDDLKQYIAKHQLENHIVLTGWRTDVKQITAALDILVLPSTTFPEGLPNSIIEAMALGKPAIATDIPGPPEIIDHETTGYIVQPGNVDEMSERILTILQDSDLAKRMGQAGRKRAEELFDVRKVVRRFENIYEEA